MAVMALFDCDRIIQTSDSTFVHKLPASKSYLLGGGSHNTREMAFILPVTVISEIILIFPALTFQEGFDQYFTK